MSGRGYVVPGFPSPMGPNDAPIVIYGFVPNKILCILAFIFFGITLIAHAYQVFRYKTWWFVSFTVGIAMEVGGYVPRYFSSTRNPYNVSYFVAQYFLIVTAPVALTAAIYACLYKMALWASTTPSASSSGPSRKMWARPKWLLWVFIVVDVVTTGLQVAGAALIGSAESDGRDPRSANNILLAGLVVQSVAFLSFFTILGLFIRDLRQRGLLADIRTFIVALVLASFFILLRIVFRLAETAEGVYGYVMTREAFFGALEFAPVVLASGILAVWHPGRWLRVAGAGVGRERGEEKRMHGSTESSPDGLKV